MSFVDYACVFVRASGDRLLAAERLTRGDPTDEVDAPRRSRKLPTLLSREEVEALLDLRRQAVEE